MSKLLSETDFTTDCLIIEGFSSIHAVTLILVSLCHTCDSLGRCLKLANCPNSDETLMCRHTVVLMSTLPGLILGWTWCVFTAHDATHIEGKATFLYKSQLRKENPNKVLEPKKALTDTLLYASSSF